jgi:hypothetical protein
LEKNQLEKKLDGQNSKKKGQNSKKMKIEQKRWTIISQIQDLNIIELLGDSLCTLHILHGSPASSYHPDMEWCTFASPQSEHPSDLGRSVTLRTSSVRGVGEVCTAERPSPQNPGTLRNCYIKKNPL